MYVGGGAVPNQDEMHRLIDLVESDTQLPQKVRHEASQLRLRVDGEGAYVLQRLFDIWKQYAGSLAYSTPDVALYRCVPARTVQKYMIAGLWEQADERAFVRAAEASGDPGAWVLSQIPPATVVFLPHRSWLLDSPTIENLSSTELHTRLELRPDVRPPYVLFRLTPQRMHAEGVGVRLPNALDAAAGQQPQWDPHGLSIGTEYVDRTIRVEAVEEAMWRP